MPTRILLLWFGVLLAGCGADERSIHACFDAYKRAVLESDGESAVEQVTKGTIEYYANVLDLVFEASAEKTRALPLVDRITVLLIRARVEPERLRQMDGRQLFIYAIDHGMVGKSSVIRSDLGDVAISGDYAIGDALSAGKRSGIQWRFYREGGRWRMDVTSVMTAANIALLQVIRDSGEEENQFVQKLVAMTLGRDPGEDIWEPLSR